MQECLGLLKEKQIVIEEHFLLQCQVSFCNFLRFLWSAEVVQRQLGLLIIQYERADVTQGGVGHAVRVT